MLEKESIQGNNMKNIVLCGSMKVKDKIISVGEELTSKGFNVLLPKECM